MQDLENAIVKILEKQKSPVTFPFLEAVLKAAHFSNADFMTINKIVDGLVKNGTAKLGIEGIELISHVVVNEGTKKDENRKSEKTVGQTKSSTISDDQNCNTVLGQEHDLGSQSPITEIEEAPSIKNDLVPQTDLVGLIDDLDEDILIGVTNEEAPSDKYEQISKEELEELIFSLSSNKPNIFSYSDEKTIGVHDEENSTKDDVSCSNAREKQFSPLSPLNFYDSPCSPHLSNRVKKALNRRKINTVGDLIRKLDSFIGEKGLGQKSVEELRGFIKASAQDCSILSTTSQVKALQALSNSIEYCFDPFGTLIHAKDSDLKNDNENDRDVVQPHEYLNLSELPLEALKMRETTTRCFRRNGITTVEDLVSTTDEQLLKLRGIGLVKIDEAHAALERLNAQSASGSIDGLKAKDAVDPNAYDAYLKSFSDDAVRLSGECAADLKRSGLDIYTEAFIPVYLPLAQQAIEVSDGDLDAARELVVEAIAESPSAISAYKTSLKALLNHAKSQEKTEGRLCSLAIPENSIWKNHAMEVVQSIEGCRLDEKTGKVSFAHPSLNDWIDSLAERDAELLTLRLKGLTLEECGQKIGDITRERVRQIISKLLDKRPLLEEDVFLGFYMTYDIKCEQFPSVIGLDTIVCRYFEQVTSKKDRKGLPLSKALSDDSVSEEVKMKIRELLNKDFVFSDGERVHIDRRSIVLHLANKLTPNSGVTLNGLYDSYVRFLENYSIGQDGLLFSGFHAFQGWVNRNVPEILAIRNDVPIRYYDVNQYDFHKLEEFVASGTFADMEISASLIFNHPDAVEIIQELDIRDEYELHYLLKNYCKTSSDIDFGRMPTITFGEGDRALQIRELIQEKGPIGVNELAELYNQKYGVAVDTFKGSYLHGFEIYKSHGVYSCSYEEMSEDQLTTLSSLLTKDYHPLPLIKLQFRDRCSDCSTSLINEKNLAEVGYRASHGLLIKKNLDEARVFEKLIDTNQTFGPDTEGFCIEVFKHEDFKKILQMRINALDIVEYEKDRYIHLDMLLEALAGKASKSDFEDYVESVLEFTKKEEPFTVYSLRKAGFAHPVETYVDEVGFDFRFLESLISTARVGGRIKSTSVKECSVFCKTPYIFSVADLFEHALTILKRIDTDELCAYFKDKYDVEFSATLARSIIKRSELVYNADIDMVFLDKDEYDRMVQEVLEERAER